jgi:hypothetical protein
MLAAARRELEHPSDEADDERRDRYLDLVRVAERLGDAPSWDALEVWLAKAGVRLVDIRHIRHSGAFLGWGLTIDP